MKNPFSPARLALMAGALFLAGCTSPAQPEGMAASPALGGVRKSADGLGIQVSGGQETSSVGTPQISNGDFEKALELSFQKAGLFASAGPDTGARFQLSAYISRITQPLMGFSMTVTLEVSYSLLDTKTHLTIWQKAITSQHTSTPGDAFAAVTRLRLATEGAAAENIEHLLREIARLNLDQNRSDVVRVNAPVREAGSFGRQRRSA